MMHSNIPANDWKKVKSEIQKTWTGLSGDDLEKTHGDVRAISGLVQKKYGLKREDAEKRLDEVIERSSPSPGSMPSGSSQRTSSSSGTQKNPGKSDRR